MPVVFGYGAVVPVEDFVRLFPGSFVINQWGKWDEGTFHQLDNNLTKLFFNGNYADVPETPATVFITTKNAVPYDIEKGFLFSDPYIQVNINNVLHDAQTLATWLSQNFPNAPIGLMMYGVGQE